MRASRLKLALNGDSHGQANRQTTSPPILTQNGSRKVTAAVHRIAWVVFAIAAVVGLFSVSVAGSVYRIDILNGNDSNDGINAPWKTMARVNAQSFQPGDQVLLHAGQTWHEALVVSSSGASGSPIVFSSYGSGPKPVLEEDGVRWPPVRVNGKAYVTVKSLQLQNASNVSVWVTGSSNVRLEALLIKNSPSHGISVDGISPGLVITNNVFTLDPGFKMTGTRSGPAVQSGGGGNLPGNAATAVCRRGYH